LLSIIASLVSQAVKLRQTAQEERDRLIEENLRLTEELKDRFRPSNIIGNSGAMQEVYDLIAQVSRSDATVLIRGESGTGKELVAHAIHYNSLRASRPFIKVSCAALPESVIESELFGHEKGAFTGAVAARKGRFELADGGTLFLDEIGDLSPAAQAKVLRAIETGEVCRIGANKIERVDVRLIAATNKDLKAMMAAGSFRPDLYHRLNVIVILLPPLRNRRNDIIALAEHFLSIYCDKHGITPKTFEANAFAPLLTYAWPGNVRELRNFIERVVILVETDLINAQQIARLLQFSHLQIEYPEENNFSQAKACFEKAFLQHVLDACQWNVLKTAEQIGMERSVLYKKMEKYGLKKSQKDNKAR
ncbi:sigma-54-dependent Fis family transcriptional regulator, partial [candidate division KSB1 bacterium]|nr:sigma-54-dependent Fis family transcriptional regulator [candidate division KSB1 bacterium]